MSDSRSRSQSSHMWVVGSIQRLCWYALVGAALPTGNSMWLLVICVDGTWKGQVRILLATQMLPPTTSPPTPLHPSPTTSHAHLVGRVLPVRLCVVSLLGWLPGPGVADQPLQQRQVQLTSSSKVLQGPQHHGSSRQQRTQGMQGFVSVAAGPLAQTGTYQHHTRQNTSHSSTASKCAMWTGWMPKVAVPPPPQTRPSHHC